MAARRALIAAVALLAATVAVLAAGPARAQDALRGKRLYLDAARIVGSGVSCVDCHGGLPGGAYGIGRAADDPALVERAVDSVPQMTPLRGRLAGPDFADLAAYIGDPAVPSPQVTPTTRLPDGDVGLDDRIEFGAIEVGAASAAATLQITNTGELGFAITGAPEVAGSDADEFSLESADCGVGTIVAPAQSCRFALAFRPVGTIGARTARFRVPHDWVYGAAAVALLGSATPSASPPPPSPGCSTARRSNGDTALPLLGGLVVQAWLRRRRRADRPMRLSIARSVARRACRKDSRTCARTSLAAHSCGSIQRSTGGYFMKAIVLNMICIAGLGACAVADPETDPVGEARQELAYRNNIFYEKFDPLNVGSINGQAGWTGNCTVAPDKNLECTGTPGLPNGQGAMHTFVRPPNRNYHLQFDVWTRDVVDATHGKLFLENPPGDGSHAILQFGIGCNNIRATFEYHANTSRTLLSFPCSNGPHYRVACIWRDGGTEFRCGASVLPADPVEADFITIPAISQTGAPEAIGAFDRVRVLGGIGERVGTTVYDKVQILSD